MSLTTLPGRRTAGTPDPAEVITITIGGRTFRAGRRTAAHLLITFAAFAKRFPELDLAIGQACYHEGYAPSAGTHDGDGVPDFYVLRNGSVLDSTEADYRAVERFMRELGWAIWFRCTGSWAARSSWHLHGVSLGCPGPVGVYVPGQVADYEATPPRSGLVGHAVDDTWHPPDIADTYFDYPAWVRDQEDDMSKYDDQLDRIEASTKAAARDAAAAAESAKAAAASAERARAGSFRRDQRLIELARSTQDDVDTLVKKVDAP